MRHVLWFVIGLVVTVIGLTSAAFGTGVAFRGGQLADDGLRISGLILMLVAGLVLGMLAATRRFSPAAPLACGLGLLALGIVGWIRPFGVVGLPFDDAEYGLQVLMQTGPLLLVGALLIVLGLVPLGRREKRARGEDRRPDDGFTAVPYSAPQSWAAPTQSWTPPER